MARLTTSYKYDWDQLRNLMAALGLVGDCWLCRGAIRCELLEELEAWDDFDVMVEESAPALLSAIENAALNSSRTFHGGIHLGSKAVARSTYGH